MFSRETLQGKITLWRLHCRGRGI